MELKRDYSANAARIRTGLKNAEYWIYLREIRDTVNVLDDKGRYMLLPPVDTNRI